MHLHTGRLHCRGVLQFRSRHALSSHAECSARTCPPPPPAQVVVHTGLLDLLSHEDELGAVLAHETGHVLARHHVRKLVAGSFPYAPHRACVAACLLRSACIIFRDEVVVQLHALLRSCFISR